MRQHSPPAPWVMCGFYRRDIAGKDLALLVLNALREFRSEAGGHQLELLEAYSPSMQLDFQIVDIAESIASLGSSESVEFRLRGGLSKGYVVITDDSFGAPIEDRSVVHLCASLDEIESQSDGIETVQRAFLMVSLCVKATYSTLCVEYSLEPPEALRKGASSYAFCNFSIGLNDFSSGVITKLERLVEGAYVTIASDRMYASMNSLGNSRNIQISDMLDRSVQIGDLIGNALLHQY